MEKIKPFLKNCIEGDKGKDILVILIVILVSLASFELGRLSKESPQNGIKIGYAGQEANAITATENIQNIIAPSVASGIKNFFASSRGQKYYPINCSAGKTIKEENKIYFTTEEEAQKAGYSRSASCD